MNTPSPLSLEEREQILQRLLDSYGRFGRPMKSACGEYNCECHYEVPRWEATVMALEARIAVLEQSQAETGGGTGA